MKSILKQAGMTLLVMCLLIAVIFGGTATYAWLSTTWNSGKFSIRTAVVNVPEIQLWTAYKENSNYLWKVTYDETEETKSEYNKILETIGVFTSTTFVPTSARTLYFGTINNLVQEQDNLPIYLRARVKLSGESTNELTLQYTLPSNYLTTYVVGNDDVGTKNTALSTELSSLSEYPFLHLQYYIDLDADYTVDVVDGVITPSDDSVDFASLFETESENLHTLDVGSKKMTLNNPSSDEEYVYIYFKFSVRTSVLRKALTKSDLRYNMPAYLIFNIDLAMDIKTTDIGYGS